MNLDNLNLVELNAQEVQEVEGGGWIEVVAASALEHIDEIWAGVVRGYKSTGAR